MPQRENFVCYASWLDIIEAYEKAGQPDMAGELAKQIIKYGVTGEMTTDDPMIIGTVNAMCRDLMDKSKKRYQASVNNGKTGGRPKKYNCDEIALMRAEGLSDKDIADNLGCSLRTVQRAMMETDDYDEI